MNEFEVMTVINRPVEDVFAAVRDVAKSPLWTPGLLEVQRISEDPLEVGGTMVYVGTFWAGATNRRSRARLSSRTSS